METQLWAIGLVFLAGIVGSFGPIYLKKGSTLINIRRPQTIYKNKPLLIGIFFYGLSTIIFLIALNGGNLSVLYPLAGTTYIWVCIFSIKLLNEKMTLLKWLGAFIIILGVVLISIGI